MKEKSAKKQSDAAKGSSVDPRRVITDERFAAAQYDPRFQRFPRAKGKLEIDERFSGMFKDKAFQVKAAVDKRGRKVGKKKQKEDMRKYYRLENEEEDWGKKEGEELPEEAGAGVQLAKGLSQKKTKKPAAPEEAGLGSKVKAEQSKAPGDGVASKAAGKKKQATKGLAEEPPGVEVSASSEGEEDDFEDEEERRAAERWARVRGLAGPDTSSESDESSISDDAEDPDGKAQDVDISEWGIGAMAGNPDEQVPEVEEETSRLAVLDLDWSKVRAVDILAMLKSFLGKGHAIKRVTVYPSDYGLQRMADEARFGPAGLVDASKLAQQLQQPQQPQQPEAEKSDSRQRKAGSKVGAFSEAERAAILETLNEQDSDLDSEIEDGSQSGDDGLDSEDGFESEDDVEEQASESEDEGSEDEQVNRRRLQLYERSRLRYYYAIVECADVATATHIYRECDGMEFEHSASAFDLRFVPATEDFSTRKVRDEATAVPVGYVAPEVGIAPMLHTKPKLTWDADDDDRKKNLSRRLTKEQLRDDDFKAYLGSESEEDDEQLDESAKNKYSQLLLGSRGASDTRRGGGKDWGAESAEEEEGGSEEEPANGARDRSMELQVSFGGGLDQLSQRLKAKREEALNQKNDTVWQAYLRRRREKKLEAKRRGRKEDSGDDSGSDGDRAEEDPFFKHDENAFDDPFFKDADGEGEAAVAAEEPVEDTQRASRKAKKLAAREAAEAERQRKAELELLLMDDTLLKDTSKLGLQSQAQEEEEEGRPKGKLSRKARLAAKKAARLARKQAGSDDEDAAAADGGAFKLNVEDSRFGELFTSPEFALDPTDPRFVDSQSAQKIIKEATKRRDSKAKAVPPKRSDEQAVASQQHTGTSDGNLKALVASLKRKGDKQKKAALLKDAKRARKV